MAEMSLLEFLFELISNEDLQSDYLEDPERTLQEAGLEDLSARDVRDALVLIQDNQTADFSREYNTGGNEIDFKIPEVRAARSEGSEDDDDAVEYINRFVTTNYVNDRDTITDNSINQSIDTEGGDFDQELDIDSVVASGDGSVAAGGDIEDSVIATGDGNILGDDNDVVRGDGNTTAFGDGDARSTSVGDDLTLGDGAGFSSGGSVTVDNSDNSVRDSGNFELDDSIDDSFNDSSDNSSSIDIEDNSDNSTTSESSTDNDFTSTVDIRERFELEQENVGNTTL